MATWTSDELRKIAAAEELELASVRRDDTLGNPVTIWVVRVGDDPGMGAMAGGSAPLRCAAKATCAGGVAKDVRFVVEADDDINQKIDAAYRAKYGHYGARWVNPMVAARARAATIKLEPRR